jgi:hypothetical protein
MDFCVNGDESPVYIKARNLLRVISGFRRLVDEICYSGILGGVEWQFCTDVSGQFI